MEKNEIPWMAVEYKNSELKVKRRVRGRDYEFFVSPYNIPQAMRAFADPEIKGAIRLELKYMVEDEERVVKSLSEFVNYEIGKFSKRLYAISLILDSPIFEHFKDRPPQLRLQEFTDVLHAISSDKLNSGLVREAVKDNRVRLTNLATV